MTVFMVILPDFLRNTGNSLFDLCFGLTWSDRPLFRPFCHRLVHCRLWCGAALEIPADLLLKSFNASYSASRAALLEAWKAFKMRREWFANDFCKPIYEIWLSEAVALGRIQAPGFFSDPLIRAAWLGSDWIGPSQGQLDPTKEISAEILANQHGYSTHEQSTIRLNGGQWEANMNQLKRENEMIAEANGTTPEAQAEATQAIASLILQNSLKEDQQHAKADNPAASS